MNRFSGLLRAEAKRFAGRRFFRWLIGLALLAYLVGLPLIGWFNFAKPSPELRAQAQAKVDQLVKEQLPFHEQCIKAVEAGKVPEGFPPDMLQPGMTPEQLCGPPPSAEMFPIEQFLPKSPFEFALFLVPGQIAVSVLVAVLLFVVGASWIGAEWSARTLPAQLFWETRRSRVLGAKVLVVAMAALVLGAVAQLLWTGSAWVMGHYLGSTGPLPKDFWGTAVDAGARGIVLDVIIALLGFAVANLIRGTGAALGIAFAYFAILERALGAFKPAWQPWLLGDNAAALVTPGGSRVYVPGTTMIEGRMVEGQEILVSNLHGGLVLGGFTVALLLLGAWLFHRRDVS